LNAIPLADAASGPSLRTLSCDVVAQARLRVPWSGVAELRRQPPALPRGEPPSSLLKHADEQTVVILAALAQAIRDHGLQGTDFSDWSVLASPRYPGRAPLVGSIARFKAESAWGVSPHLIPHRSLHSTSGTVSHALKTHGPNFGVAGSPGSCAELLLNAAALLSSGQAPALWLLFSRVEPEAELDPSGNHLVPVDVEAVVLALAVNAPSAAGFRLTFVGDGVHAGLRTMQELQDVRDLLEEAERSGSAVRALPDGGRIEVRRREDRP
jgi:hypothetical protein